MKVFGAFRVSVKMLLMWNSTMQIDGGETTVVTASVLEVRNLAVLRVYYSLIFIQSYAVFLVIEPYFIPGGLELPL